MSNWAAVRYLWGRPDRANTAFTGTAIAWHVAILASTKIEGLSSDWGIANLIGLSYLTFRQIHLLLEAPHENVPFSVPNFLSYLLSPLTLIAGPVQLWQSHLTGLRDRMGLSQQTFLIASQRITTGLIKVLILAPIFAGHHDLSSAAAADLTTAGWFITFYSYYLFLFLDFSGYVDVMIGIAIASGFSTLPENFRRPYLAANFQEFWGRWHITLGQWFRDHLFNPIYTSLLRYCSGRYDDASLAGALFATFFVVGLWHGIAWNFAVFGVIHASGIAGVSFLRQKLVHRVGADAVVAYENRLDLRVVRVLVCQHAIAASFLLLDNDVANVWQFFGG